MVMESVQVRLSKEMLVELDKLIEKGIYSSRGEAVRDSIRRFVWNDQIGTIKNGKNSLEEIKKVREKLSKKINLDEINNL